ncbi:MAG: hypothetical protein C0490_07590, partial [Marivirga sp.]|nr:hypothetical protein [Marivirga sp.]
MKIAWLNRIIESGVKEGDRPSKKRTIVLSNYIAITLAIANILIFIIIPGNHNLYGFLEMISGIGIFLIPLLLNRLYFTNFSKLYECWLTPVIIIWFMTEFMKGPDRVPISMYDGLRFYLLATSCIPYLVWERKDIWFLIICILPGFIGIVFCDTILNLIGVGYEEKGVVDAGYVLTSLRSFIAYIIINGICLSLKLIIDAGDVLNEKLFSQLAERNKLLREQSEEKLRLSESKYRSLFEQASDAIVITDLKGNVLDSNAQATQMLGYTRAELLELNVKDLIDKEQLKQRPVRFDLLAQGQSLFNERSMVRKDGSSLVIETSVKKIGGDNFLGIMRDISQRKKIELELREAEAKFRNLVEQSLVGVYILLNGKFAYVNPRFAEIFGYTQDELTNSGPVEMIVYPDDRALVSENIRSRLQGKEDSIRSEFRGKKKNGETIWLEAFGTSTRYGGEKAIIGTVSDITERKEFENQQALFVSLVNSSEDAIISIDLAGHITSWNRGAAKLFGHQKEEVIGQPISLMIPNDCMDEEVHIMNMVRAGMAIEHFETQRLTKGGDIIYVSLTVSPVLDTAGNIIGASRIARDVTGRKQTEKEKDRARHLLNERIKELKTLYNSYQILQQEEKSVNEAVQEIVDILPAGWQYPEISAARITIGTEEFQTSNFKTGPDKQTAQFRIQDGLLVSVDLVYLVEKPKEVEGPFLAEERDLINMLAEMLRIYLVRKHEGEALKRSEANLNATINNTTFFIWSVNNKYEIKNMNKPFKRFIKDEFHIEVREGESIVDLYERGVRLPEFSPEWFDYYRVAMEGGRFRLEKEYAGRHFKFSLNPIIENETVGGVSVFSEETSELKRKEKELYEANKQIDDLKLMALRAAMNPHFIFNTLNSIQYYIMENDQRNAVNYLSTFSKLIRSILNNSVFTKVKLADELEMLRHYISLERMRFENKFDFTLVLEPSLDIDNIEIPSMLIQPYVENAILHGINNKVGRGNLKIGVKEETGCILFEIEDDGIGRQASGELQRQNLNQHKSFGTTLTEERLKLINTRRNVSFEII